MGLQFIDPGGEYYFSLGLGAAGVWTGSSPSGTLTSSAAAGRSTTYAIANNLNTSISVIRNLSTGFQSLIAGAAFYINNNGINTNQALIGFRDSGTNQVDVRTNSSFNLVLTRNGTVLATSTNAVFNNQGWVYVELKATIASGTSGSIECRVNNVVWATASGVNTQNSANASANNVAFSSFGSANTGWYLKDIYILDQGTGVNTTYLGDITIQVIYPNAAGTNQAWTANGAGTQVGCVQDGITHTGSWPDGDTTYISSATAGQISDFAHQTLTLTGSFYGAIHATYMRKDDVSARSAAQVCLSGATTEVSASIGLGTTYNYYFDILETDPNTSAAWTLTNFNNATFGVKELT